MERKIKDLRPGDSVIMLDGRILYIKNIYGNYYNPIVVIFEYTDDSEKCNKNYTRPEQKSLKEFDFSVATPSYWFLEASHKVPF